jgi:flagellar basal body rod protein FlgF
MTADGYLLADQAVHPAGYVVAAIYVVNSGSASATVTVRATSSSGTTLASGSVAATGSPVTLTLSGGLAALYATGGKIHVAGGTVSSPLAVTVVLQRG